MLAFERAPLDGAAMPPLASTDHRRGWVHCELVRKEKGIRAHGRTSLLPLDNSRSGRFLLPNDARAGDVLTVRVYHRNAVGRMRTDARTAMLVGGFDEGGIWLAEVGASARDGLAHAADGKAFSVLQGLSPDRSLAEFPIPDTQEAAHAR